ncbi:MAG: hypothetical protein GY791_17465 [Alphaproteobacteria bacterium]|nr:hypothetical protein [Alphaproteobacteria bacterium]
MSASPRRHCCATFSLPESKASAARYPGAPTLNRCRTRPSAERSPTPGTPVTSVTRIAALSIATILIVVANAAATRADSSDDAAVAVKSGDIRDTGAVLWARCNRARDARLRIRLFAPAPQGETTADGPNVSAASDYTGSVSLDDLAPGTAYTFRIDCIGDGFADEGPVGSFRTAAPASEPTAVRFVWVADIAGQGWGQNPDLKIRDLSGQEIVGGYLGFEFLRNMAPDFAILAGDNIYADNPIPPLIAMPVELGGGTFVNDPAKDFVARSLADYRANWRYNLADSKYRAFHRATPIYVQWDDHEVTDNWYPGEILTAPPYHGIDADTLAARARQAMFEYNPIAGGRLHRKFRHGRHLEIFLLDLRSYRGPNSANIDPGGSEMLGAAQFDWLVDGLRQSAATWKVISTTDPLSVPTGRPSDRDGWAQGDRAVLGREVPLNRLLRIIKDENIKNVIFIAADVHFTAAIAYDPRGAAVDSFRPFWEFVAGPLHAGAFGPVPLDQSFGPRYAFARGPGTENMAQNTPPPDLQSFGSIEVNEDGDLIARLHDISGAVLFEQRLSPE